MFSVVTVVTVGGNCCSVVAALQLLFICCSVVSLYWGAVRRRVDSLYTFSESCRTLMESIKCLVTYHGNKFVLDVGGNRGLPELKEALLRTDAVHDIDDKVITVSN